MPKRPSDQSESSEGQPAAVYRYVGAGSFLGELGIPARDLTAADVAALDAAAIESIESSGLYEKVVTNG